MIICEFIEAGRTIRLEYNSGTYEILNNGKLYFKSKDAIDAWNVFIDKVDTPIRNRILRMMKENA